MEAKKCDLRQFLSRLFSKVCYAVAPHSLCAVKRPICLFQQFLRGQVNMGLGGVLPQTHANTGGYFD